MPALISIITTIIGIYIFFRLFNFGKLQSLFPNYFKEGYPEAQILLLSKLSGFLLFGFIPGLIALFLFKHGLKNIGLTLGKTGDYWYLIGIIAIVIGIIAFISQKPKFYQRYPEIRSTEWTKQKQGLLSAGWIIYLLGYEFLFRGLLFFTVYQSSGLFLAIFINVTLYSGAHFTKGKTEILGAIPFGILLCFIAYLTNSILLPFLIHLSLALSTDLFSLHFNPNIKFLPS